MVIMANRRVANPYRRETGSFPAWEWVDRRSEDTPPGPNSNHRYYWGDGGGDDGLCYDLRLMTRLSWEFNGKDPMALLLCGRSLSLSLKRNCA